MIIFLTDKKDYYFIFTNDAWVYFVATLMFLDYQIFMLKY